jgi:hypothetical protein
MTALPLAFDSPASDFEFQSEYVKSLLRQRNTPDHVASGKENVDVRWKTPATMGTRMGRSVLGERDGNVQLGRSVSVGHFEDDTPAPKVETGKLSSRYVLPRQCVPVYATGVVSVC